MTRGRHEQARDRGAGDRACSLPRRADVDRPRQHQRRHLQRGGRRGRFGPRRPRRGRAHDRDRARSRGSVDRARTRTTETGLRGSSSRWIAALRPGAVRDGPGRIRPRARHALLQPPELLRPAGARRQRRAAGSARRTLASMSVANSTCSSAASRRRWRSTAPRWATPARPRIRGRARCWGPRKGSGRGSATGESRTVPFDPLRVGAGVSDRSARPVRDAKERDALHAERDPHRFEVGDRVARPIEATPRPEAPRAGPDRRGGFPALELRADQGAATAGAAQVDEHEVSAPGQRTGELLERAPHRDRRLAGTTRDRDQRCRAGGATAVQVDGETRAFPRDCHRGREGPRR